MLEFLSQSNISMPISPEAQANMDADRELLARAEQGEWGWRLYTWEEPALTLGMNQDPERDLLPGCPLGYAMRPTGGRAVLHGHDLTLGVAVPLSMLGLPEGTRSLTKTYTPIARWIIAALRGCGVEACLGDDLPQAMMGGRSADCFAHVAGNDIVSPITRKKVCGCAQRITDRAILLQASIPVREPWVDLARIFAIPSSLPPNPVGEAEFRAALGAGTPLTQTERL